MNKIIQSLEQLAKQIEDSKTRKNQLSGRLEEQLKTLKELGFPSIVKAKDALVSQQAEQSKLEKQITEKYTVLKSEYEWEE